MNKNTFRKISYGLYIISTWDCGRPVGCTANSAMQITSEPATIAISINKNNYTNKCIKENKAFSISILSVNSNPSIIGTFGFQSSELTDKFKNIDYDVKAYQPVIKDSCGYIICSVIDIMETETHTVFLGKVSDAEILTDDIPMTYDYYHNTIKGKSPKNAPTYISEENEGSNIKSVKCSVCGYEYSGDIPFDELPDDWKCPVCGQTKKVFK